MSILIGFIIGAVIYFGIRWIWFRIQADTVIWIAEEIAREDREI